MPHSKAGHEPLQAMALEYAPDPVVIFDAPPAGGVPVIRLVNRRFEALFGYPTAKVAGKTPEFLFGDRSDMDAIRAMRDDLYAGRATLCDVVLYSGEGQPRWWELNVTPVYEGEQIAHWICFYRDIDARKAVEQRLEMLMTAVDRASDFFSIFDATPPEEGGPLVAYANRAYIAAVGKPADQVIGQPIGQLMGSGAPPETRARVAEAILERRDLQIQYETQRADGTTMVLESRGSPVYDEHGRYMNRIIVSRDIGERRRLEKRIELLTTAIEDATDFIFLTDATPISEGGPFIEWANATFTREMRYPLGDIVGRSPSVFFGERTDHTVVQRIREAIASGRTAGGEFIAYRADGTSLWVEFNGRPLAQESGLPRWIAVGRDITERRRLQHALMNERATLATVFELAETFHATLDEKVLRQRFAAGSERLLDANASARLLLLNAYEAAVKNARLYRAIEDQRASVLTLTQTKSDLIAMLAHDFKNPLTSILGFSELLEELPEEEKILSAREIRRSAERLLRLANNTLAQSRLEQNELTLAFAPLDYVALVRQAVAANPATTIAFDSSDPVIEGEGDAERLQQVFENLLGNALKYSARGNPVRVTVTRVENDVIVNVIDRGIGIPADDLERVFARFTRAHNVAHLQSLGSGFGLYFAKTVVEQHAGRLTVKSVLGEGSTFTATLPLVPTGMQPRTKRVLLLDADGTERSYSAHVLRSNGYAVAVIRSVADLDAELERAPVDAVLLDIERAGTAGEHATRKANELQASGNCVLVLTTVATRRGGALPFVIKPYLDRELLSRVDEIVSRNAVSV